MVCSACIADVKAVENLCIKSSGSLHTAVAVFLDEFPSVLKKQFHTHRMLPNDCPIGGCLCRKSIPLGTLSDDDQSRDSQHSQHRNVGLTPCFLTQNIGSPII